MAKISQVVGMTDFTIEYSRPSKRGRAIVGNLIRFGELWRTGANKNTTIEFSDAIMIHGKEIPSGKYAIYTLPNEDNWVLYFYSKTDSAGIPKDWEESKIVLSIVLPVQRIEKEVETFTIGISDIKSSGANINLSWENTSISLPVEVLSVKQAMLSIEKTLSNNPKAGDYYNAAVYYLNEGHDLNQAKTWISKAVEMNGDAFWMYRQQSLILAGLNETSAAIAAAKKSLKLAINAGNKDYEVMNNESIEKWSN
tara:strand:- start:317 stop:1075 length:759 start_codon:yes stop_codon:yes gene_type:complete